jgi:hypothetical protein
VAPQPFPAEVQQMVKELSETLAEVGCVPSRIALPAAIVCCAALTRVTRVTVCCRFQTRELLLEAKRMQAVVHVSSPAAVAAAGSAGEPGM